MRHTQIRNVALSLLIAATLVPTASAATAATAVKAATDAAPKSAMFGDSPARNMVSSAKRLPTEWDLATGKNILWTAKLGSQSYAGPVLLDGKIYVGTNNESPRDPKRTGDKGVIMAFVAETGEFLWHAVHDKLPAGRVNDWPLQGICSTPYIEGNRLYYVSNRAEMVCADTEGFRDGENDGPVTDEKLTGPEDVDIVWSYDMIKELDVFPHNLATCSPTGAGDLLFTVTGNGVDEGHVTIPSVEAPSFATLSKKTATLIWENAGPGERILHGQWSNPSYGIVAGVETVVMPGGDGYLRGFEPLTGKLLWRWDCNPKDSKWELGGSGTRNNIIGTPVIDNGRVYVGVGQDPEHGEGVGHLWAIDPSKGKRDDTSELDNGALVWHLGDKNFNRSLSTVAISGDLLFAADLSGFLYCLDLATGAVHWKHDTFAAIWSSPWVADGKVYLSDEDGDIAILAASKTKKLIAEINMGNAVYTTPAAVDGTLYIASRSTLYAIRDGVTLKPPATAPPTPATPPAATKPAAGPAAGAPAKTEAAPGTGN